MGSFSFALFLPLAVLQVGGNILTPRKLERLLFAPEWQMTARVFSECSDASISSLSSHL